MKIHRVESKNLIALLSLSKFQVYVYQNLSIENKFLHTIILLTFVHLK